MHIHMKQVIGGLAGVALLTTTTVSVFAVEATPTLRPGQQFRQEVQEIRQETKTAVQTARQEFRVNKASEHGSRLEKRFAFYAQRLNNIIARIQRHIDAKKNDGKDVSNVQSKLDNAKQVLATAVSDGQKAVALFKAINVDTWDVQRPEIKAAIEQANKARKGFVETRRLLIEVVQLLRQL